MSLFRRRTRRPQRSSDTSDRRNSMIAKKRAERMAKAKARAAERARKQKPRRTITPTVDPMPNSPERQRRRNRQPAIDPPKGAGKRRTRPVRPKPDNKTVTPVRRARRKPSERFNRGI